MIRRGQNGSIGVSGPLLLGPRVHQPAADWPFSSRSGLPVVLQKGADLGIDVDWAVVNPPTLRVYRRCVASVAGVRHDPRCVDGDDDDDR